jgi:hypothetical protein
MAVSVSDIEFRYSNPEASAGSQLSQIYGHKSLGGFMALTKLPGLSAHELFSAITGLENANLAADYAAIFVLNKNQTDTATNVGIWIDVAQVDGVDLALGVDPTVASRFDSQVPQARTTSSKRVAPVGVVFSAAPNEAGAVVIGTLGPGQCRCIWIRRATTNSDELTPEAWQLKLGMDV